MQQRAVVCQKQIIQTATVQEEPDIALLRRLAAGEKAALGVLYDRHAGLLLALGVRIVGVRREAEDLVHDVFLEAWRHAGDYQAERGSVKTWLLLRMRSRCLDKVRSHSFARSTPFETETDKEPSRSGAADRHERRLDGARARALLEQLPQGQREVLELGYFEGLSFSEIALQLDIPIGTVKSRVAAAMTKLRADLGVRKEAS